MQDPTMIIVHPGKAHTDDFLSCCLLLAKYSSIQSIERREPTKDELNDPTVVVVDVGGQCDPILRNYDHHQFDRDHEPCCALTLVVRHELDMEDQFREHGWFIFTEMMDSKGPNVVVEHFGWSKFPSEARSPIDRNFIDSFGLQSTFSTNPNEDFLFTYIMVCMGRSLIEETKQWSENLRRCIKETESVRFDNEKGEINAMMMTGDPELISCMYRVRQLHYPDAAFSIVLDQRGNGYALYRYDDNPRLDFSKLEGHPLIQFAHKNGFMCTTKEKISEEQIATLLLKAMI